MQAGTPSVPATSRLANRTSARRAPLAFAGAGYGGEPRDPTTPRL